MAYDMDADFAWFIKNQEQLVAKYNGKTLAIKDGKVLGAYDSVAQAIEGTALPMGSYLIQLCIPGEEAYTITFHTLGVME